MDGAPVLEVAYETDVEVVECALGLVDRIEVEKTLRGVHVCSVAGVDDGHGGNLGGVLRSALDVMAHDNDVGVVGHHEYRVFQCLAFCGTRHLGIGEADDFCAETVGGCLETEAGAGGRFEEKGGDDAPLEKLSVRMELKLFCHVEKVHDLLF